MMLQEFTDLFIWGAILSCALVNLHSDISAFCSLTGIHQYYFTFVFESPGCFRILYSIKIAPFREIFWSIFTTEVLCLVIFKYFHTSVIPVCRYCIKGYVTNPGIELDKRECFIIDKTYGETAIAFSKVYFSPIQSRTENRVLNQ